jgi:antitoxin PrlF
MKAIVSEKGQVTIPKPLRTRLGLSPGAILEFEAEGGRLVARKAQRADPVDAAWGVLDLGEPVDAFLDRARGR